MHSTSFCWPCYLLAMAVADANVCAQRTFNTTNTGRMVWRAIIRAKHIRIIAGSSLMLHTGLEENSFFLQFRLVHLPRCCFSHLLSCFFSVCQAPSHRWIRNVVSAARRWRSINFLGQQQNEMEVECNSPAPAHWFSVRLYFCVLCAPYFCKSTWATVLSRSMPLHRLNVYSRVWSGIKVHLLSAHTHEKLVAALALL